MAHSRWPLWVALIAVVLTLPSLRVGWLMDDHFHRVVLTRPDILPRWQRSPMDLFRFLDGDPEKTHRMMEEGFLPWWTYPNIRGAFWRPVTVLTHWLDFRLWPNTPVLMHVQSVLWYGLLAGVVAVFYRRIMAPLWVAGLAAVLYAIDGAHGVPVGWLANRNAILATLFGVVTLIAHDHFRRGRARWAAVLAPLVLAISLLSAEAGLGTCAYLFAYAVFLDSGSRLSRLASLLPYAFVIILWRIAWSIQGFGAEGLGMYADPLGDPRMFVGYLIHHPPILLLGQWATPPSDLAMVLEPRGLQFLFLGAVAATVGIAVVLWPLVRRDRLARFWACGMVLSVIPVSATIPSDRLLFFVGLGAMGLIAMFLASILAPANAGGRTVLACTPSRLLVAVAWALVCIHLVAAPIGLVMRARYPLGPDSLVQSFFVCRSLDDSPVAGQDLIIVNAPFAAQMFYLPLIRALDHEAVPQHTRVLAPAIPWVSVARVDDRTLRVRPAYGFLAWAFDTLFRNERHSMRIDEKVVLAGMTAQVTALTADGRPAEAVFQFDHPLEDASLRWVQYKDGRFVPFTPPAVGQEVVLRAAFPL